MKTPLTGLATLCLFLMACQPSGHVSTFSMTPVPADVQNADWIMLTEDQAQDGRREDSADGKAFYYYYDQHTDTLWFKLELYNEISEEAPAVSVSLDIDLNQQTGIAWYGANSSFTFEKMLSVGPTSKEGTVYTGYNGITNAKGVTSREWINEKQGVLAFHVDHAGKAYYIGVKRTDIAPHLQQAHVIGSVGQHALWNDDIGETGYATIDLTAQ